MCLFFQERKWKQLGDFLDKTGLARVKAKIDALLSLKMNLSLKGTANGVAELDANGHVPSRQLPSYVDDVMEYQGSENFPTYGEEDKIYVDTLTGLTYRWSGSMYVEISESLALGETSATAYRGDRGKSAYDHATAKGSQFASGLYKITTNSEGHVTAAAAVVKSDITDLGIPGEVPSMTGATALTNGTGGGVPAPAAGDQEKYLRGDGVWGTPEVDNKLVTYVVNGDICTDAIPADAYVVVKNSTISGASDGFYKANSAISANTTVTAGLLTATNVGEELQTINSRIVYSSTQPTGSLGMIWLKPKT